MELFGGISARFGRTLLRQYIAAVSEAGGDLAWIQTSPLETWIEKTALHGFPSDTKTSTQRAGLELGNISKNNSRLFLLRIGPMRRTDSPIVAVTKFSIVIGSPPANLSLLLGTFAIRMSITHNIYFLQVLKLMESRTNFFAVAVLVNSKRPSGADLEGRFRGCAHLRDDLRFSN